MVIAQTDSLLRGIYDRLGQLVSGLTTQPACGDPISPLPPMVLEDAICVVKAEMAAMKEAQEDSDSVRNRQPTPTNEMLALDF